MVRTILAGVIAGIAMFMWQGFAHTVLPLGHTGLKEMSAEKEAVVLSALGDNLSAEGGLYYYPGFGLGHHPSASEMKAGHEAYMEKAKTSAHGLVLYHAAGSGELNEMNYYIGEATLEIVETLLIAFLVAASAIGGFFPRVMFVTGVGLVAAITTNGSYWNWYGFPVDYTLAYGLTQLIGFVVAGIVIALVVKKPG